MQRRRDVLIASLGLVGLFYGPSRAEQTWPQRPIKLVVPLVAGGGVDVVARVLTAELTKSLGQNVIVENQGGAGGTIAAASVSRAEPDGYTFIFQSTSAAVINALVYKHLSYDPMNFAPVSLFASSPLVATIGYDIPANNLQEFIALLKAHPGQYSYGSSGVGTITHVAGEYFKQIAGVDIIHVPYRGNAAVLTDLLAGRVALMFDSLPLQLSNIRQGRVKPLGVITKERSPDLPDVPTMDEVLPGYELPFWMGLYAPAKTPKEIINRVAAETAKAAKNPKVIHRLAQVGVKALGSTAAEFNTFWHQQLDYYGRIIKTANISID